MFEQIIQAFCLGVASKGSGKGLRQGFGAGLRARVQKTGEIQSDRLLWAFKKSEQFMAPNASNDQSWSGEILLQALCLGFRARVNFRVRVWSKGSEDLEKIQFGRLLWSSEKV